MANFYTTLPAEEIARQVAELLNNHNILRKHHTARTITIDRGAYFVDIIGGQVIGCSAIWQETKEVTRQFHLCVHPSFRRQGLGRKLKLASLSHVVTPYAYVTVREDNVASINLNTSLGFVFVKKDWVGNHNVLTLGRMMVNDQQRPSEMDTGTRPASQTSHGSHHRPNDITNLFYTKV